MEVKPDSISKSEKKKTKQDNLPDLAKAIISGAGVGIYIVQHGKFVYVSDLYQKLSGYAEKELIGAYSLNNIYPDDREMVRTEAIKCLKRKSFEPYEYRFIKKKNEVMWVLETITPIVYKEDRAALGSFMDITGRKKAEELLRQSEDKYRTILETIQEGYFELDLAGNFTFVNDSMCRLYGYFKKEIIGMNYRQYTDKENAKKLFQVFNKVYTTGKPLKESGWQAIRKDGTKIYVESSASLQKNSSGKTIGFKGIIRDITERIETEEKMRESENLYRAIFENTGNSSLIFSQDNVITLVNTQFEKRTGYKKEEVENKKKWMDFILKEDLEKMMTQHSVRMKDPEAAMRSYEFHFVTKSGEIKDILLFVDMIKSTKQTVCSLLDITEQKQAEEKLRKSEANYRQLFDNAPAVIYRIDYKTGRFLNANDVFCKYFGCTQEEILSLNPADILTDESKKLFIERMEKISQGKKVPVKLEYEVLDKKGRHWTLQLHVKNIYDAEGHVVAADVVAHDITERKKAEEELKRFAENLEDTNIALRVLMNKRGEDQREFEEKLQVNINDLVIPYLKKLSNSNLDDRNKNYVSVLESNLSDVLSPFMRDFRSSHKNLTPQEIQIVDLILKGRNTKEIADMLNASANTIATHRNNIRKKMNLRNSKINLRSYIMSINK